MGMVCLLNVTQQIPPFIRFKVTGKLVMDMIEREPKIKSVDNPITKIDCGKGIQF